MLTACGYIVCCQHFELSEDIDLLLSFLSTSCYFWQD